jgi:diaminobutyrate acetyltransferase
MLGTTTDSSDSEHDRGDTGVHLRRPTLADGAEMWRMARDSQVLDLNSSYTYLLWCREFAAPSVVATVEGEPAGFITGFMRPEEPETLMVWQVAVDPAHRGKRLATRMLGDLVDRLDGSAARLETTVTEDNEASIRLFTSFAAARGAGVEREPVFTESLFPDGHDTEVLFRIGPLSRAQT